MWSPEGQLPYEYIKIKKKIHVCGMYFSHEAPPPHCPAESGLNQGSAGVRAPPWPCLPLDIGKASKEGGEAVWGASPIPAAHPVALFARLDQEFSC